MRVTSMAEIEQAVRAVTWARDYTDNVEFSPEDAGRSDIDFLCRLRRFGFNSFQLYLNGL